MNSDTHDSALDAQFKARQDTIDRAIRHIGEAIAVRRSLLGIRQSDLSERTGIQSSQISRVEGCSTNGRLSTIITLLDELGLLDDVLKALPTDCGNEIGERVGTTRTQTTDIALKPLSTGQFLTLFDHDPTVEAPVSTRASIELRRRGFAVRQGEHPTLGSINYVTAHDNAVHSEYVYITENGTIIGGYKHLSVIVAGHMLTDEQADAAPLLINNIAEVINGQIDMLKLRVKDVTFDADATAHIVTINGSSIDSAYIYDKICGAIQSGDWMK